MKTRYTCLISSALFLSVAPSLRAMAINWTTGTAGDTSGAWNGSASTFNGQSYTAADDLILDGSATKTITLSGTITTPLSFTISGTGTSGTTVSSSVGVPGVGAITLIGTSLGGTLVKTGSADLILASANTFGAVTLSAGKFFLNNAAGLGTTGTLTVNSGAASGVSASYQNGALPGNGTPDKFFFDSTGNNADYTFSKNITFGTVASATTYGMAMRGGQTRTTTLSGDISGGSNLTLWLDTSTASDGASIWRLSGDNSGFAGTIRLNRGRLFLDNANASGTGTLFIQSNGGSGTTGGITGGANGGNLVFGFSGTINNTEITLNSGGSGANFINTQANDVTITGNITTGSLGMAKMGAGKLTLTNTVNSIGTRPTTIAEGTLSLGGAGRLNSGSYSGTISLFTGTSVLEHASSASQILSGDISGSGRLVKSGSGTLTISGNNAYSGGTTLTANTTRISTNDTALGTGDVTVTSATLDSSATVTLATANGGGARALANNVAITNNGTGTTTLNTDGGFAALTLNGVISGDGNFATTSSGTVNLGGVNTYTGTTTVSGTNTLRIAGAGQLGAGNYTNTISIGTSTTFDFASSADQTLGGVISGAGALTKTLGSGSLTLTNSNSYTGTTIVSAGTLALASTGHTGTGAVTVQTGGTLLGTGLVQGSSFTAQTGSTVQAGDDAALGSFGTLSFTPASGSGSFDFQSGSSIILGLTPGGIGDLLDFNGISAGTLNFNGNLQVTAPGYLPMAEETFQLLAWENLTTINFASHFSSPMALIFGNGDDSLGFDLPNISGSGYGWDLSQFTSNGSISVVVVPEPGRILMLILGLGGMALRRSRTLK